MMRNRISIAARMARELARSVRHLAPSGVCLLAAVCGLSAGAGETVYFDGTPWDGPKALVNGNRYVFTKNFTYVNTTANSAARLTSGTAYIEIPEGVTVTLTGGDANGATGAGAGIRVDSGATLTIFGSGTLNVTGGNAANGGTGGYGNMDAFCQDVSDCKMRSATGGKGGDGGDGGARAEGNWYDDSNYQHSGKNGNNGIGGDSGSTCGTIEVRGTVTVNVKGGDGSSYLRRPRR